MRKPFLHLACLVIFGLLITACSKQNDATPNAAQAGIIAQNLALTKAMVGTWNTQSVKDKGVLVYARNANDNAVDYGSFQIDLKSNAKFSMIDKDNNKIEGEWYVAKGNLLNLEYEKNDFKTCAVASTSEACTTNSILVTISFDLIKAPANHELLIQNKTTDFLMNQ